MMVMYGSLPAWARAAEPSGLLTYEALFTPEGRKAAGRTGTYHKDPHVWVYTQSFAQRFGMPKQWIDDTLKGAQALAYRVDWDLYGVQCGYFGETETCSPAAACVLDMYIPDTAKLPWNNEMSYDSMYGRKSNRFFRPQFKDDKPGYVTLRTQRGSGVGSVVLGLDAVGVFHKHGGIGNYTVVEYDRRIYEGLDYVSGTMSCGFTDLVNEVRVLVAKPVFWEDGRVRYMDLRNNPNAVAYGVYIPDSFMRRVHAYAKEVYEPNSLWSELKKRMGGTSNNGKGQSKGD